MLTPDSEALFADTILPAQLGSLVDLVASKAQQPITRTTLAQLSHLADALSALSKHRQILSHFSMSIISHLFLAINHLTDSDVANFHGEVPSLDIALVLARISMAIANGLLVNKTLFEEFDLHKQPHPDCILLDMILLIKRYSISHTRTATSQALAFRYLVAPIRLTFLILYKKRGSCYNIPYFASIIVQLINLVLENTKNLLWLFFKLNNADIHENLLVELLKTTYMLFHNYKPCVDFVTGSKLTMSSPNIDSTHTPSTPKSRTRSPTLNTLSAKLQPIISGLQNEIITRNRLPPEPIVRSRNVFLVTHNNTSYLLDNSDSVSFYNLHLILVFFAKLFSLDKKFAVNTPNSTAQTNTGAGSSPPSDTSTKFSFLKGSFASGRDADVWNTSVDLSGQIYKNFGAVILALPHEFFNLLCFSNHHITKHSIMASLYEYYSMKPIKVLQLLLFGFLATIRNELSHTKKYHSTASVLNPDPAALIKNITNLDPDHLFIPLTVINHILNFKNSLRNDLNALKKEIHNNRLRYRSRTATGHQHANSIDNLQFEKSLEFFQKLNFIDEISEFFEKFLLPSSSAASYLGLQVFTTPHSLKALRENELLAESILAPNELVNGLSLPLSPKKVISKETNHKEARKQLRKSKSTGVIRKAAPGRRKSNQENVDSEPLQAELKTPWRARPKFDSASRTFTYTGGKSDFDPFVTHKSLIPGSPTGPERKNSIVSSPFKRLGISPKKSIQSLKNKYSHQRDKSKSASINPLDAGESATLSAEYKRSNSIPKTSSDENLSRQEKTISAQKVYTSKSDIEHRFKVENEKKHFKELLLILNYNTILTVDSKDLNKEDSMLVQENNCYKVLMKLCKNPFAPTSMKNLIIQIYFNLITEHTNPEDEDADSLSNSPESDDKKSSLKRLSTHFMTKKLDFNLEKRYSSRLLGSTTRNSTLTIDGSPSAEHTASSSSSKASDYFGSVLERSLVSSDTFSRKSNGKKRISGSDSNIPSSPIESTTLSRASIPPSSSSSSSSFSHVDDLTRASTVNDFFLKFQNLKNLQKFLIIFLGNDLFYLIFMFFQKKININEQELRIITEYLHLSYGSGAVARGQSQAGQGKEIGSLANVLSSIPSNRGMSIVLNFANSADRDNIFGREITLENSQNNVQTLDFELYQVSDDENEFVDFHSSESNKKSGSGFSGFSKLPFGNKNSDQTSTNRVSQGSTNKSRNISAKSFSIGSKTKSLLNLRKTSKASSNGSFESYKNYSNVSFATNYGPDPNLVSKFEKFAFETTANKTGSPPSNTARFKRSPNNFIALNDIDESIDPKSTISDGHLRDFATTSPNDIEKGSDLAKLLRKNSIDPTFTYLRPSNAVRSDSMAETLVNSDPDADSSASLGSRGNAAPTVVAATANNLFTNMATSANLRGSRSSLTSIEKYEEAEKFFGLIEKLSKK